VTLYKAFGWRTTLRRLFTFLLTGTSSLRRRLALVMGVGGRASLALLTLLLALALPVLLVLVDAGPNALRSLARTVRRSDRNG
jgi:hypothetical protein